MDYERCFQEALIVANFDLSRLHYTVVLKTLNPDSVGVKKNYQNPKIIRMGFEISAFFYQNLVFFGSFYYQPGIRFFFESRDFWPRDSVIYIPRFFTPRYGIFWIIQKWISWIFMSMIRYFSGEHCIFKFSQNCVQFTVCNVFSQTV